MMYLTLNLTVEDVSSKNLVSQQDNIADVASSISVQVKLHRCQTLKHWMHAGGPHRR